MEHSSAARNPRSPDSADASRRLVLVGAGHAHVEVLRRFGLRPPEGVRLTLVSNSANAVYSGMLPGFIAGHFDAEEIQIPVEPLARFADCELVRGEAVALDPTRKAIRLNDGREFIADVVSIDVGAVSNLTNAGSRQETVFGLKPIESFAREWESWRLRVETGSSARIAIVGAGAAGVELAFALQHRLRRNSRGFHSGPGSEVTLVVDQAGLVPNFSAGVRHRVARLLSERSVAIVTDTDFRASARDQRRSPSYDVTINAAGVILSSWLAASGLALDQGGFVAVDACLQSVSHSGVFAAGDAAGMVESPRPKAGVIAVRQGPILAENLRRCSAGEPLLRFIPQETWLSLISAGDRYAIASRGDWSAEGHWVWRWKRWIDRRFVSRYTNLPISRSGIANKPGVFTK